MTVDKKAIVHAFSKLGEAFVQPFARPLGLRAGVDNVIGITRERPGIVFQGTHGTEIKAAVFDLETLQPHGFVEDMQVLKGNMVGFQCALETGACELNVPSDGGLIRIDRSFIQYFGHEFRPKLRDLGERIAGGPIASPSIRRVSIQDVFTYASAPVQAAYETMLPAFRSGDFQQMMGRGRALEATLDSGETKVRQIIEMQAGMVRDFIEEAQEEYEQDFVLA